MIEVLLNATIVYNDGVKERYDAIYLTKKMIVTGRIFTNGDKEKFQKFGFIPRFNIKDIYNGSKKKIQKN
jgi:hypothetical protein